MAVVDQAWSPSSWRDREALHQPEWPDVARLVGQLEAERFAQPAA